MFARARVSLLVLLSALLLGYVVTGQIYLYIQDRSVWLVALSVPLLLAIALGVRPTGHPGHADRWAFVVVSLPLLAGLIVPARPLGAAALDSQNPAPVAAKASSGLWNLAAPLLSDAELVIDMRQLADLSTVDPSLPGLEGRKVSLVGFVYRTSDLPSNQFFLERFVVRCCTADAIALNVLVQHEGAATLARESWVQVDGQFHYLGSANASVAYVDAASLAVIPQPSRPYVYP